MDYLTIKAIHILSSVLMVGTGFGTAFYLFFVNCPVLGDIEDDIVCGFNEATVVAVDFILYIGIDGVSFATVFLFQTFDFDVLETVCFCLIV